MGNSSLPKSMLHTKEIVNRMDKSLLVYCGFAMASSPCRNVVENHCTKSLKIDGRVHMFTYYIYLVNYNIFKCLKFKLTE